MYYFKLLVASNSYKSSAALIYSSKFKLKPNILVTVPLRRRYVNALVLAEADKPNFKVKPVKTVISSQPLPEHVVPMARWLSQYYVSSLSDAIKLFTLPRPMLRKKAESQETEVVSENWRQMEMESKLTKDQDRAIDKIDQIQSHTILLHGDTASGKTRVYIELAKKMLEKGKSLIILTPEISLTSQLVLNFQKNFSNPIFVLHSQLTYAQRKKIWLEILNSQQSSIVIGARSAIFCPLNNIGLIIIDEAHELAYKQDQSPKYQTTRVASQLANLTNSKTILGTATPLISDYYVANEHKAIITMKTPALGFSELNFEIVDNRQRNDFQTNPYISDQLIKALKENLNIKKQSLIYLNRRGTARLILCTVCGWQMMCPNCDVPLIYHGDKHVVRCHICGITQSPPSQCPVCSNLDIVYKNIGTKAIASSLERLFPNIQVYRFDSDNPAGERANDLLPELLSGKAQIVVGTQILAKGFDLPNLGLVGVISAEDSLSLPDYSSEEKAFQLLYQVIGRVARGHGKGKVVLQTYNPDNPFIKTVIKKDYLEFYNSSLKQRQAFKFPPYSYLLKLSIKNSSSLKAQKAATDLKLVIEKSGYPVEVLGPAPNFYFKKGKFFFWQLVIKSKDRKSLISIATDVEPGWSIDLDPSDLL